VDRLPVSADVNLTGKNKKIRVLPKLHPPDQTESYLSNHKIETK
jgi:hypothetical protein